MPIAWSGKGMYRNCCDNVGEVLPDYWRQTFAGTNASDWDFSRFIPDMLLINLGTNDFGHDGGTMPPTNILCRFSLLVAANALPPGRSVYSALRRSTVRVDRCALGCALSNLGR